MIKKMLVVIAGAAFALEPALADSSKQTGADGYGVFVRGRCYPTLPLGYMINQKVDETHYGAVRAERNGCNMAHCRAYVEIQHFDPATGGPLNIMVEWLGTMEAPLQNGFTATADLLRECAQTHPCGQYQCPGPKS